MPIYAVRMERSDTVFMTVEAPNWEAVHGLAFAFVETAKATSDEWTADIKELEGSVAERTKAMALDDDSYYFVGLDGSYGGAVPHEPETGKPGSESAGHLSEDIETVDYVRWLETKASSYDRIMSGGKKTLKEWANIFGLPFALGRYSQGIAFKCKSLPVVAGNNWWPTDVGDFGFAFIDRSLIDFTGDWTTSLTLPDKWEEPK